MPADNNGLPEDDGGWQGERRTRAATDAMVQARLEQTLRQQRELRDDIRRLREDIDKNSRADDERGFLIRRIDERVTDLFARLAAVEAKYLPKEEYERTVGPIRKWATWIAMTIIGAVLAAVLGMVINKGGVPH